jgi:hypothetical protein
MDGSNPYSGDQDSMQPGPGQRDGGQFWPPGRWQRPTQAAVGLGVAAAVLAGGIITATVTAAGSPAPVAARTLAAGPGPIDTDTAQLLTVLGLGGPPGAFLTGPGGAIAAGPGGAVVSGPAGEVVAGPGLPPAALRCAPPGFQIAPPGRPHGRVQRVTKARIARIQRVFRNARITRACAGIGIPGPAAMYGQVTFQARDGKTETAVFERGVIQSLSGNSLVVKAANGQTQTWQLSSDSQIRTAAIFGVALPRPAQVRTGRAIARNAGVARRVTISLGAGWLGRAATRSDLKAGRNVLVVGTVANGTRTVRLAVILPAVARAPAAPVPPPSPSASASASPSASGT